MPHPEPADERLSSALESMLLVAGGPVAVASMARSLEQPQSRVNAHLRLLQSSLRGGIRVQLQDGHAQLVTAPENVGVVQRFLGTVRPPALSRAALETLALIAYRQPITRSEIETARGVHSDRVVQTLLARGLIDERGQRPTLGRPMEYGTTFAFLEYFGLGSLEDLPPLKPEEAQHAEPEMLGMVSR